MNKKIFLWEGGFLGNILFYGLFFGNNYEDFIYFRKVGVPFHSNFNVLHLAHVVICGTDEETVPFQLHLLQ